jgi:hypothetical protein
MNKTTGTRTATTYNLPEAMHESWSSEDVTSLMTPYTWPTVEQAEAAISRMINVNGFPYVQHTVPGLSVFAVTDPQGHVQTIIVIEEDDLARLHRAVRKAQPVTISYTKADGTDTVRTIEPTRLSLTKAGDVIVKALDRESGAQRSFRTDRISAYTVHRTRFLVRTEAPAPSKAELVAAFVRHTERGYTGRVVEGSRAFGPSGWSVVVKLEGEHATLTPSGTVRASERSLVQV